MNIKALSASNNAITGKARVMHGKRISHRGYDEMLRCSSVPEIAAYLKHSSAYSAVLAGINETDIHRGQLEQLLNHNLFIVSEKLCRHGHTKKNLAEHVIINAEIGEILRFIVLLDKNGRSGFISGLPGFLLSRVGFDLFALADGKSYDDLLKVLSGTEYFNVLQNHKPKENRNNKQIDLNGCEVSLYTYYYRRIFDFIDENVSNYDKKKLKELYLLEIETRNLTAAYRLINLFGFSGSEIKPYIYPFYYRISQKKWDSVFDITSPKATAQSWMDVLPEKYTDLLHQSKDSGFIENTVMRKIHQKSRKLLYFSRDPVSSLHAYIFLCKIELDNIFNIIEGVRYKVESEKIRKMLII